MTGGAEKVAEESITSRGQGYNDYALFVRNFISPDKPHLPLPYNTITRHKTIDTSLNNLDQQNDYDIGEILIGTYAIGILVRLISATNFMTKINEGVQFSFYYSGLDHYFVVECLSSAFYRPVYTGSEYLLHYFYQPIIPLPLAENPSFGIFDASGVTLAVYLTVLALEGS